MAVRVDVRGGREVLAFFQKVDKRLTNAAPPFRRFAQYFRGQLIQQFATEGAHFNTPWEPLKPEYGAWKQRNYPGRKILQREGTLRDSLMRRAMSVMTVTNDELVIGTDVPYASAHHEGRGNLPQRRIIVATPAIQQEARNLLSRYIVDGES